ncbi:MAG: CbtA family protein, partial [Beijerinckiaceae bacterium]
MITRVLSVSLLAGLCAGLFVAVLQHFSATPLILRAETYESHEKVSSTRDLSPGVVLATAVQAAQNIVAPKIILAHAHGGADHATTASDGWKPENGLERTAFTGLVTVGTAIGFAFLLIGAMLATGDRITPHTALAYAGAAFFAIGLAPAAGLAPELPGSSSAALEVRQIWWIGTALASALGVFLVLKQRSLWLAA